MTGFTGFTRKFFVDGLLQQAMEGTARRVHAGRARLKLKMGDAAGSEEAAARASEVINYIASNVKDENLRNTFLTATSEKLKLAADERG